MSLAIRCEGLSKRYRLGTRERYRALRDVISEGLRAPFRRRAARAGESDGQDGSIWALKDVNLEVQHGDVIGIIGRNGAGKSTLLKILSRITEPTEGTVTIRGRVGSLLEVGTGFHPELTGRENIYLNGAILGMKKAEIARKFDEIVAFAEIERFLDTPVKHYSSGMYVRLAFAVAAHLEPEILLVDEVLAVGDAAFQRKCLGKMGEVAREGRTVLFVSHQLAVVQNLCPRALMLDRGVVAATGTTPEVIGKYVRESVRPDRVSLEDREDRRGSGAIRFLSVEVRDRDGGVIPAMCSGEEAILAVSFENRSSETLRRVHVAVGVDSSMGHRIALLSNELTNQLFEDIRPGVHGVLIRIPRVPFAPGRYGFTLFGAVDGVIADWIQNAGFFEVEPTDFYRTGKLPPPTQGDFLIDHRFTDARGPERGEG